QDRTRSWMEAHDFFETTGISEDHVVFCLERYQKAGICTELGIRAFVDDRADVLGYIDSSVTRYLFDSPYTSPDGARSMGLVPVATWEEIARLELA
ncbi:MAG: hypothetical protein ABIP74_02035, partial [Candidatus Saccharimonas sp.]